MNPEPKIIAINLTTKLTMIYTKITKGFFVGFVANK